MPVSPEELGNFLRDNAEEIVTEWSRALKANALGSTADRPLDELESLCRQCLEGITALAEQGDHTRLHWYVHREVRGRVALGFRASEIARELTSVKAILWPLLADAFGDKPDALPSAIARLDGCVDSGLFELQDEYERVAQAKLEEHLAEMEAMNRRLEELSVRDPLTGLYNRRYFMDRLAHEFQRAVRHARPLAAVMIDLDHFKLVNDTYGHQVGDEVLRTVALLLVNKTRATDIAARYGGEEFVAVLPETDGAGAMRVAEKLREAVAVVPVARIGSGDAAQAIFVTISAGVAGFEPGSMKDPSELLRAADEALYAAKNAGRNRALGAWSLPKAVPAPAPSPA